MRKLFVIPLLALAAVAFTSPATTPAAAATTCGGEFGALADQTRDVTITARDPERERNGLARLVDDAAALADLGKTADAVTKLRNFEVKVDQLEAAGRITAGSANDLRAAAEATIACLQPSGA